MRLERLESRRLLAVLIGTRDASPDGVAGPFLPYSTNDYIAAAIQQDGSGEDHDHNHEDGEVLGSLPPVGGATGAQNTNDGSIGAVGQIPSALYDPDNLPTNSAGLPLLESLPGASTAVFIDFDGWSSFEPFDYDGNPNTFNADEQGRIWETWRQAAAYLTPFDANVTTIEPDFESIATNYELVSNSVSGGYSYLRFPSDRPWGFNQRSDAPGRTSGILHEIGHNYSLRHQSAFDDLGNETREYSFGDNDLEVPTLGVDFGGRMHRLYIGHTNNASGLQDDLAIIQSKIVAYTRNGNDGFRGDDHGADATTATALVTEGLVQKGSGVIERLNDVDAFTFSIDPSTVSVYVRPERSSPVDLQLEVWDSSGNLVASGDQYELFEHLFLTADATETYTLLVRSHGDYAELGSYEIFVQPQYDGFQFVDLVDRHNYKNGALQNRRSDAVYDASTGSYMVHTGSGDIWGTQDDMAFVHRPLFGDGQITVRVNDNTATHGWTKAGVMIRETTARNSKHAFMSVTGNNGIAFQYRENTGGGSGNNNTADGNRLGDYVRLTRAGDMFTGKYSTDGTNWTTLDTRTIPMNEMVYVGLVYTNQSSGTAHNATFDSLSVSGEAVAPANSLLPAPTNVVLTAGQQMTMDVSWDAVAGADQYLISRSNDGFNWDEVATIGAAQTQYLMTGLDGDRQYFVGVTAIDSAGDRSQMSNVVHKETRPGAVTGFRVSSYRTDELVLDWNEANGEIGYRVERTTDGVNWTNIAEMGAQVPSYTDTGLAVEGEYTYRVITLDDDGDAATSAEVTRQTRFGNMTGLRANTTGPQTVQLTWNDTFSSETGFKIERKHETGDWSTIATAAADATVYDDTTVTDFGRFTYRVSPTHAYLPGPTQSVEHWMDGAIALFEFTDSGDTLLDTGTANASLSIAGTNTVRDDGRTGGGLLFNGMSSAIDLMQTASLHGDIDFSVWVWLKTTGTSEAALISQGGTSTQNTEVIVEGIDLRMLDDGKVQFRLISNRQTGETFTLASEESVNDGYWHHVVAVRSGDTGRLFLDGRLVGEEAGATNSFNGDQSVYVGYDGLTSGAFFDGFMDGVRISDSAMTEAEIDELIDAQNSAPTATGQTIRYEIDEDQSVVIDLSPYASDPDGDRLQGEIIQAPANGVTGIEHGNWIYTPNLDYFGNDSFTFTIVDHFGAGSEPVSTVSIVVRPINDPPRTNDFTVIVPEGTATLPIDLLSQTMDPEGTAVTIDSVTQGTHGAVSLDTGIATYASLDGPFAGIDEFTYTASDEDGLQGTGTVTLVTNNLVHRWKLDETSGTIAEDFVSSSGNATGSNINWTEGQNGGAVQFDGVDDTLDSNAVLSNTLRGTSSLVFWIRTTQTGSTVGWNSPGVTGIEQAGGQTDMQWGWIDDNGRIRITARGGNGARSTNPINNGQWQHIVITRDSESGLTELFVNGQISESRTSTVGTSTLEFNQIGVITDTGGTPRYFSGSLDDVRIYDRAISSDDALAIFNSLSVQPPSIADDSATTDEDNAIAIDVLANDGLTVGQAFDRIATKPSNGSTTVQGDGTILYTPNQNFFGTDSFTYWVAGDGGLIDEASVTITVNPINDAPTAIGIDNNEVIENTDTTGGLVVGQLSASDVDSSSFTYVLVAGEGDVDNGKFEISGRSLQILDGQSIDHESQSAYGLRIQVSDGDKTHDEILTVSVRDLLEASKVAIADDEIGRSQLSEIVVEFDALVDLNANSFVLEKIDGTVETVPTSTATEIFDGKTRAKLSFSGGLVMPNGSLADGNYRLTLVGAEIASSANGQLLDGNQDGVAGDDFVIGNAAADKFFRHFGDNNGDRNVDALDFSAFLVTFKRSDASPAFNRQFDVEGNDRVDALDFSAFLLRYRKRLDYPS